MTEVVCLPAPAILDRTRLVARAKELVRGQTTQFADHVLRVPLSYYRDRNLHDREVEAIRHVPLALVHRSQIPNPSDFVVRDVLGTSVLISRGGDGTARAFLNVCRHRGAKVAEGCGSKRRHTCPYHAWTYDSAGALVGLPGAAGFDEIDRASYGLVELPSEERHGFIWGVLTAGEAIDVASHLGPLDAELGEWCFETYQFLTNRGIETGTNWKAGLEAFAENYHFPIVHRQSVIAQTTQPNTALFDRFGRHHRLTFPCSWIDSAPDGDYDEPLDFVVFIYWVYPNLVLASTPVGLEIIDILPGGAPTDSTVLHGWAARQPAPDDETLAGYTQLYEQVHAAVRDEDAAVLRSCGDAVRYGQHGHMLIGRNEIGVQNVVRAFSEAFGLGICGP
ncbi:MAG: aromatic ring-hydroxylating oxygenase subunit alpha [Phycisphaerales bacterium]